MYICRVKKLDSVVVAAAASEEEIDAFASKEQRQAGDNSSFSLRPPSMLAAARRCSPLWGMIYPALLILPANAFTDFPEASLS